MKNSKLMLVALLTIAVMLVAACGGAGTPGAESGTGDTTGAAGAMPTAAEDLGLGSTDTMTDTTGAGAGVDTTGTPTTTADNGAGSGTDAMSTPTVAADTGTGTDTGSGSGTDTGAPGASTDWQTAAFTDAFAFLAEQGFQSRGAASSDEGQSFNGTYNGCTYDVIFTSPADDPGSDFRTWVQEDVTAMGGQDSDIQWYTVDGSMLDAGASTSGTDTGTSGSGTDTGTSGSGTDTGTGGSGTDAGMDTAPNGTYDAAVWVNESDNTARIYLWNGSASGTGSDTSGAGSSGTPSASGSDSTSSGSSAVSNGDQARIITINLSDSAADTTGGDESGSGADTGTSTPSSDASAGNSSDSCSVQDFVEYITSQAGWTAATGESSS